MKTRKYYQKKRRVATFSSTYKTTKAYVNASVAIGIDKPGQFKFIVQCETENYGSVTFTLMVKSGEASRMQFRWILSSSIADLVEAEIFKFEKLELLKALSYKIIATISIDDEISSMKAAIFNTEAESKLVRKDVL